MCIRDRKNLVYALERLEKCNLQLVAASARPLSSLIENGWDPALVTRLSEVWVSLPQLSMHTDDVPEISTLVLSHLIARNEVPSRSFSSGALNALRLHHWQGEWAELLATIKNLALSALDDDISVDDVDSILLREARDAPEAPPALPLFLSLIHI